MDQRRHCRRCQCFPTRSHRCHVLPFVRTISAPTDVTCRASRRPLSDLLIAQQILLPLLNPARYPGILLRKPCIHRPHKRLVDFDPRRRRPRTQRPPHHSQKSGPETQHRLRGRHTGQVGFAEPEDPEFDGRGDRER